MAVKPSYEALEKHVQALEKQVRNLRAQGLAHKNYSAAPHKEKKMGAVKGRCECLVDAMTDWGWTVDVNGRYAFSNPAVESILGYEQSEVIGRSIFGLVHPESRPLLETVFARSIRQKRGWAGLGVSWRHRDGSVRRLESTCHPDFDDDGRLIGFSGIDRDVTSLGSAEQALRDSEKRMQSIFRAAPTGIGLVSDRRILKVNERMCEMTGFSSQELVGKNARMLYPSDADYAFVGAEKYRQIKARGTGTVETRFKRKDGRIIDVLMSSTPIDPSDWSKGVTFTALDISVRKQAEKALMKSEAKYRTLFEKSADAIFIVDRKTGRYLEANTAGERLTGRTVKELKQLRTTDVTPSGSMIRMEAVDRINGITDMGEVEYVRPDGTVRTARLRVLPLDRTKVYGIAQDVTERKKLQSQLTQAQKMESVGRLAGGVAHDFNNMLSVILGNAEIALGDVTPDTLLHTSLTEIQKAAQRSAGVTRQLLAFARRQTIAPEVLDLNHTMESMLKMLRRLIGEDINLVWSPGQAVWTVKVDPSQVDQVLANLCVNARDAMKDGGTLTISTENRTLEQAYCNDHPGAIPGDYLLLTVSDDGRGMDKQVLDKLFEPFFTTKESGKGTGLGMATVYGIVKQNNGFIAVDSSPGKGTRFEIYLPRHRTGRAKTASPALVNSRVGGSETVLVVEDEISILKTARVMLQRLGYRVLTASLPGEAIAVAAEHEGEIHLIMTDVIMPGMNGRELADQLVKIYPEARVLFMSGYTADAIARHGVLEDGVNFIMKPFSSRELSVKVRTALDH